MAFSKAVTLEDFFAEAVNLHKLGVDGDKEAVQKAHRMFKTICNFYPQNYLAQAYLGNTIILLGRDEDYPYKRSRLARKGLKILDRAVSKEPENTEIGLLRDLADKELRIQEGVVITNSGVETEEEPETCLSDDSKKQLEEAKELHRRALAGDKEATQKAFAFFEQAHRENPDDHLILAYYADCLSMVGRDSADHSLLFGNAIKAMMHFDKAVNGSSDNIEIRLLRANHSYRLPEGFFRRSATAIGDYEYLIQRYERDNSIFDKETYLRIMDNLGKVYERLGINEEAQLVWDKLFSLTGDTKYQALSKNSGEETHFDPVKARSMTWKQALQEGIRLHRLAVAGNKKAARIAAALLEGLYKANPNNTLAEGYYGSSVALVGRNSGNPSVMFSHGIKGLKLLNKAVARDSQNPQLRLLRGYLAYNLPETFFHLSKTAIEDFRFLIQAYDKNKSIISRELYWQILHDLGAAYQRLGDNVRARKIWSKLVKESKDPKYQVLLL